ncbi:formylglycine-generating enzyme family protein [Ornithinimicrobium sufpigmenti]|uniref:formylglycine-generating enzyme family protein n=1 Tax=Ornithinimicrobium sufpigmenti TaxID=2508882 RepID=UPI001EDF2442|nr:MULTISPECIES: formylglycine-generating enzyme family protein [unclassified Ornithinimicrobium]
MLVPGGQFVMGSDDFYPEERPAHPVRVSDYLLQQAPVTVTEFARFVAGTGYVTVAERVPDPRDYPEVDDPSVLVPGALVFTGTSGPVPLNDPGRWWSWVPGASWRHPEGPGSDARTDRGDHPVTQVCLEDAQAYARWAGLRLPTEAEHERASRGDSGEAAYAWGEDRYSEDRHLANTWQGSFPYRNTAEDGWATTSPVGSYPANCYGAVDLIGNVWEWTADRWTRHPDAAASPCCVPADPRRPHTGPARPRDAFVVKGGSHLCAPEYCLRYRPPARQPQERDSATTHLGFRCAASLNG